MQQSIWRWFALVIGLKSSKKREREGVGRGAAHACSINRGVDRGRRCSEMAEREREKGLARETRTISGALKQRESDNATQRDATQRNATRSRGIAKEEEEEEERRIEEREGERQNGWKGRASRDRARCNARAALYKQHVGRRSPRSSQGHPGNVPMPPMQDKFSHSTESGDELAAPSGGGAQGARARALTRRQRRERERKLRLGWATRCDDAHHPGHRSSQKRPCYATSRQE